MEKERIFFAPSTLITIRKHKKKILKNNIGPPSSIIAKTNIKRKPNFFVTFFILLLQENTMSRLKTILSPHIPFVVRKYRKKTKKNSWISYPFQRTIFRIMIMNGPWNIHD
jgi:hypothetical protein